ncbi:YhdP family protein [Helicobacter monodelphidis]|uniref:YhdP family protein n=1 Tax=Helicobacter sp. 15-1451 TaxID=2004995 RepID=UPI0015EC44B2|nr:AsmA-like C-terminal domain-containing protein [Helicobacter sp. 15-1451]
MKSKPILAIFIFFSVILLLFLGLYSFLKSGIYIPSLTLGSVKIQEFYLTLDKKLNIVIDDLQILQDSQSEENEQDLQENVNLALRILKNSEIFLNLIGDVEIKKIIYQDYVGSAFARDNHISVQMPDWRIEIDLFSSNDDINQIRVHFAEISYLPKQISITGAMDYDFEEKNILLRGALSIRDDFLFNFHIESNFEDIMLEGSSLPFGYQVYTDILQDFEVIQSLSKEPKEWILENIQGDFQITKVTSKGNFSAKNILQSIIDNLYIEVKISTAKIFFQKTLSPIILQEINGIFHKGEVNFSLVDPFYEDISLQGSNVSIEHIFEHPNLNINILTKTRLNQKILKILEAYEIQLPISQKNGNVNAELQLSIPFDEREMSVKGRFVAQQSNFSLKGFEFSTTGVEVLLKDNFVAFENMAIETLSTPKIKGSVSMILDTQKMNMQGKLQANKLVLFDDGEILNLPPQEIPFFGDFKESVAINFPTLPLELSLGTETSIHIQHLLNLSPYSKILQSLDVRDGHLTLKTVDFKNFTFKAGVREHNLPILTQTLKPLTPLEFSGNFDTQGRAEVFSSDGLIHIKVSDIITLSLRDIVFAFSSKLDNDKSDEKEIELPKAIHIQGSNITLFMLERQLPFNQVRLEVSKQKNLSGTLKNGNSTINISYFDKVFAIHGEQINEFLMNKLLGESAVKGGKYTLTGEYKDGVFKGNVILKNATFKSLVGLQNIIAFLDSAPSLLLFKSPGFDNSGYKIKSGSINLEISDEIIRIDRFEFDGSSVDSQGAGVVRIGDGMINFHVKIAAFKNLSTLLNNIPLMGYIITGQDGSFSTFLEVTGTTKDVRIQTNILKQTIQSPAYLLERILKTPMQFLKKND